MVSRAGMLPARPLGERMMARLRLQALERGESIEERARVAKLRGGPPLRSIWAWQTGERGSVHVDVAAEALDSVDLQLIDAYDPAVLEEWLPPVSLDD